MNSVPRLLDLLDRKSDRLLARLAEVEPAILHARPVPGAWSPLQVMHHIALVERASTDYLLYKYGDAGSDVRPLTLASQLRGKLAIAALLSPLKFQAPEVVNVPWVSVLDAPTLRDLRVMLEASRLDLRQLLDRADPHWLAGAVYRHPRVGYISLTDLGRMLVAHHERHARQIDRALAQNARDYRR